MGKLWNKNKKIILNGILTLCVFVGISVVSMLIFWACGIIYFDADGMKFNAEIFDAFKNS